MDKHKDEFKEKVGKSLARRHLIIKVLSDFNDILDVAIKVESTRLNKLVEFKNILHNIETFKKLKKMHVTDYQVTIDGLPSIHDNQRVLENGGKTFDVIMNKGIEQ